MCIDTTNIKKEGRKQDLVNGTFQSYNLLFIYICDDEIARIKILFLRTLQFKLNVSRTIYVSYSEL